MQVRAEEQDDADKQSIALMGQTGDLLPSEMQEYLAKKDGHFGDGQQAEYKTMHQLIEKQ